ncbi:MAG: SEC-C metal-binding domain-containing protein [Capsulimonadaceae bacterium]|nr:SEC-C metal-binding domain-containing protein [Capsulimonadaceae bacterium]
MSFFTKIFDHNDREVKRYRKKVEEINAHEPAMQALSDDALAAKTDEFRQRCATQLETECAQRGKPWEEMDKEERRITSDAILDPMLPEVFAVVREASRRILKMRHFDVQMIGGMVTHDGRIAELRTGEGKTLMATLPLYLNALFGKGAHLVTPNDYLSKYGAVTMGPLYHFLGMTVGIIQGASPETGDSGGTFQYDPTYRDPDPRYEFARPLTHRREAYACDITYGTNNEYGFDYLRDNCVTRSLEDLSQTELFFAIVDEGDSILIDEARTPLIISGPQASTSEEYVRMDRIIRFVQEERDYTLDEKGKSAMFTEEGQRRVEQALGIENLADAENLNLMQHAVAALKAHAVFKKDIDYVIKFNDQKGQNEVVIVDEFTGRLMFGRRWSDGLHQAVEAKEGVKIESESQTYATITFQNYFRLYTKLSGMTGTAKTEEEELRKVYALDVVVVPTNKPMIRKDNADVIHKTQEAKYRSIALEILRLYAKQQPVLVGTRNIEASERVSDRLRFEPLEILAMVTILREQLDGTKKFSGAEYQTRNELLNAKLGELSLQKLAATAREFEIPTSPRDPANISRLAKILDIADDKTSYLVDALEHGVPHNILNAKFHEKEAQIISEAGRKGSVTIATNMAGRGVDIILGGTVIPLVETGTDEEEVEEERGFRRGNRATMLSLQEQESNLDHKARADEVRGLGGLFILGTERHESRRIDNQLRGRAGRQGDPGESRFFVSMEDELMRLFGDKSNWGLMQSWSEEQSLDVPWLSKMIERAQRKVEAHNFDIRKNVLQYDDVMNTQREVIYGERRKVLEGYDLRGVMINYLAEVVDGDLGRYASEGLPVEEWDLPGLYQSLNQTFPLQYYVASADEFKGKPHADLREFLIQTAEHAYEDKEKSLTPEIMRDVERHWTITVLDRHWMEHLTNMDYLREGIGWRGYAGTDPLVLYKKEAFDMFQLMLGSLQDDVVRLIFNTQVQAAPPPVFQGIPGFDDIEVDNPERLDEEYAPGAPLGLAAAQTPNPFLPAQRATAKRLHKVGRNDPCPCGSGKKYKVCHGK